MGSTYQDNEAEWRDWGEEPSGDWGILAALAESRMRLPPKTVLVAWETAQASLLLVQEGVVGLWSSSRDGRSAILDLWKGPSVPNLLSFVAGVDLPGELRTVSWCTVCRIRFSVLNRQMRERGDVLELVLFELARIAIKFLERLRDCMLLDARRNLERFIAQWVDGRGRQVGLGKGDWPLGLKQREVAEWLGVSPQYLSALAARIKREGRVSK